jgi:hypothetical protein
MLGWKKEKKVAHRQTDTLSLSLSILMFFTLRLFHLFTSFAQQDGGVGSSATSILCVC